MMFCLVLVAAASCEDKVKDEGALEKDVPGYAELIQAYEQGKVFVKVEAGADSDKVLFKEGSSVIVPHSSFRIHDHGSSPAPSVEVPVGSSWWSVGGVVTAIPSETGKSDADAQPVYVYYDAETFHMYLSNRNKLTFNSQALIDKEEAERLEEERQQEIARRQNIPVVRITTVNGAGIYDKENYVDGTITIEDPEKLYSEVTEFSAAMGIRGRGNSTWSFPKKPWKVKLKEKASLLGMPADKEWCLLANYADRTLLRNIVAMKLSEICGFPWTPRMHSVEVYLNGSYQGVYTLCEHKKVSSDRVDIDVDAGDVYLEIEEQQDETTCWWTGMGVPMMFSDPEEPSSGQLADIKDFFSDFEAALRDRDFSETTGYPAYIDVDSFIDYYIVQELTKNVDGNLRKSSFLTKEQGKKLEMYHLWDFDLTLGNCGYFGSQVGNGYENFWIKRDRWYPYLFNDPVFVDKLQTRWSELLPQFETIPDFIELEAAYLEKARERNFQKWSINESVDWVMFPSLGSYEKELEYLKEFYTRRLSWLNVELNKL